MSSQNEYSRNRRRAREYIPYVSMAQTAEGLSAVKETKSTILKVLRPPDLTNQAPFTISNVVSPVIILNE